LYEVRTTSSGIAYNPIPCPIHFVNVRQDISITAVGAYEAAIDIDARNPLSLNEVTLDVQCLAMFKNRDFRTFDYDRSRIHNEVVTLPSVLAITYLKMRADVSKPQFAKIPACYPHIAKI